MSVAKKEKYRLLNLKSQRAIRRFRCRIISLINLKGHEGVCPELDITLNDEHLGILHTMKSGWKMDEVKDQELADAIGEEVCFG